jgi:integrase
MTHWLSTKDSRIKKRDGVYWARFMKKGRRVEVSLDTKSFELAKRQVEDMEARVLAGKSWKKERQLFEDAWIEFLKAKADGDKVRPAREKTLFEYSAFGVRYFTPFFGKMRLGDIDDSAWREFVEHVRANHAGIQFFNIVKYFSGFLTWAEAHGKITDRPYLFNPDARAELEREEYSPGKAYTKKELKRLRAASKSHGRFYLFMLMAQYMGMRPSEISQLRVERIDVVNNVIELKKADTKTNIGRRVPIHPTVRPHLLKRIMASAAQGSSYLFPHAHVKAKPNAPMDRTGFKKVWYAIAEAAGVEGRMYDFRHTFITHAIEGGMNPAVVAEITGTSLRIIQKHYLHLSPNDLNRAINGFRL